MLKPKWLCRAQVSKRELENVKQCKSALNRLLTRVGKMRQTLEDILDDDQDMQDCYLGRRAGEKSAWP